MSRAAAGVRRSLLLALLVSLAGCASLADPPSDYSRALDPQAWGPQRSALEWWYVGVFAPEDGIAVCFTVFRSRVPRDREVLGVPVRALLPGSYLDAVLASLDLGTCAKTFEERHDFPCGQGTAAGPPLALRVGGWALRQQPDGNYRLEAGRVRLTLTPEKAPIVHAPGLFALGNTCRLAYQSVTRLAAAGTVDGRPIRGSAWMDHQWGCADPGRATTWDWAALHLSEGGEMMIFHMRDPTTGKDITHATLTDDTGQSRALVGVTMGRTRTWRSPRGAVYGTGWHVRAADLDLTLTARCQDSLWTSVATGVPFWHGFVEGSGTYAGAPVQVRGMGESLVASPGR